MQILFIIGGLLAMLLGLFTAAIAGSPKADADWQCYPSTSPSSAERCSGSVESGPAQLPTLFVLSGLGLEIAAAAVSIGGRRPAA